MGKQERRRRGIGLSLIAALSVMGCETKKSLGTPLDEDGYTQIEQPSICGSRDDSQWVNDYNGTFGMSRSVAQEHQRSKGAMSITGIAGLDDKYCSGTLIGSNLFITAGHCIDDHTTSEYVVMNFEREPSSSTLRTEKPYRILKVLERNRVGFKGTVDYAILQLEGSPGLAWGTARIAKADPPKGSGLVLISHPDGDPKKIVGGSVTGYGNYSIRYSNLDTLGGSSGGGLISTSSGELVGVHTNGGCGGVVDDYNYGMRISVVRSVSTIVAADCLFNWAEANYATALNPAGMINAVGEGYVYRYYPGSNSYLGVKLSDGHVHYLGADGQLDDLGHRSAWQTTAGCQ